MFIQIFSKDELIQFKADLVQEIIEAVKPEEIQVNEWFRSACKKPAIV